MRHFEGFDHIDCRVRSLAEVEAFYDGLMPALGLSRKEYAVVDEHGDWHDGNEKKYNVIEYHEEVRPVVLEKKEQNTGEPVPAHLAKDAAQFSRAARVPCFIGIIEYAAHVPGKTRIAFRVSRERFDELETLIRSLGAIDIQHSEDMNAYPAIFFTDPAGTHLEFVARRSPTS